MPVIPAVLRRMSTVPPGNCSAAAPAHNAPKAAAVSPTAVPSRR